MCLLFIILHVWKFRQQFCNTNDNDSTRAEYENLNLSSIW